MSLEGHYFSGAHGKPALVRVRKAGDMLEIVGGELRLAPVPIAEIDIEPPLAGMARHLHLPGGATLEMPDTPELASWFHHSGKLEQLANWLENRWPFAIGSLVVTAVTAWALYTYALPGAAKVIAYNMPQSWQNDIAEGSTKVLRRIGFFESNIPLERQQAIRAAFAPMIKALPDQERYRLEFRNAPFFGPNAFALPGGRMVILDDLIELTDDDEEILGVLAHELGHAYHRHPLRGALQSGFISIIVAVTIGDASGLASLPIVGLQASYTRNFEKEADVFAIEAMQRANISPAALARMFEKLRDAVGMTGNEETWFSSHPAINERIKAAQDAAGGAAADGDEGGSQADEDHSSER